MAGLRNAVRTMRKNWAFVWSGLVLCGFAAAGWMWHLGNADQPLEEARMAALAAARANVGTVLSYSAGTVEADLARSQQLLTGSFAVDFQTLANQTVVPAAKRDKVTTTATVSEAGVVNADDDRVTVLLFVTQSTTSTLLKSPKVDGSRVEVVMTRVGGTWLISSLNPV